jgi:hypothetical protein
MSTEWKMPINNTIPLEKRQLKISKPAINKREKQQKEEREQKEEEKVDIDWDKDCDILTFDSPYGSVELGSFSKDVELW